MNAFRSTVTAALTFGSVALFSAVAVGDGHDKLPDPDGKPADMRKPVKVFICMGQSNMLEYGKVAGDADGTLEHAVKKENLYPFLVDDEGNWTERKDVRKVAVMQRRGNMSVRMNDWLKVGGKIGVEIGIGQHMGEHFDEPVLIIKSAIGNRALGWDLLPPGSEGFEFTDSKGVTWVHPGYKGSPEKWKKGEEPKPIGWYAGLQYDADTGNAKKVLAELDKYYPGATKYEIAGFFWWQGDRDSRSEALSSRYEKNLAHLIKTLRKDFDAPNAKFVCATLGQHKKGDGGNAGKMLEGMFAVSDAKKYPEFKGNVATVYTNPLSMGSSSGAHYSGNAKAYMNVGLGMGKAMAELLAE